MTIKFKAALYKNKKITIENFKLKKPQRDQIVVANEFAGICGSDLHNFFRKPLRGNFKKWKKLKFADGHELSGRIVSVGEDVKKFNIGDYVVSEAVYHCKQCENCKKNLHNICIKRKDLSWFGHGAFSELSYLHQNAISKFQNTLSSKIAALAEPLASVIHAFNLFRIKKNFKILVLGGGSLGTLLIKFLNIKRIKKLYCLFRHPHQTKIVGNEAKKFKDTNDQQDIFDVIFECTGSESGINDCIRLVKKGGKIILLGSTSKKISVDFQKIINKEINLKGSLCYSKKNNLKEIDISTNILLKNEKKFKNIISHVYDFNKIGEAFNVAYDKKKYKSLKVLIQYPKNNFDKFYKFYLNEKKNSNNT